MLVFWYMNCLGIIGWRERKTGRERERMRDNGKKRICYIYCNIGSNEVFFIFTCTGRCRYILFLVGNLCMWYGIFRILGIRIMLWNVAFRNQGWYIWNQGLYVCNLQVMSFELPFIRQNIFLTSSYNSTKYTKWLCVWVCIVSLLFTCFQ